MTTQKIPEHRFSPLWAELKRRGFSVEERWFAIDTYCWVHFGGSRSACRLPKHRVAMLNAVLPARGVLWRLSPEETASACRELTDLV